MTKIFTHYYNGDGTLRKTVEGQNDLSAIDVDEVSPVRRGAIGRAWALFKADDNGDLELSKATVDALGSPFPGEEAFVGKLTKAGIRDDVLEGLVAIARLAKSLDVSVTDLLKAAYPEQQHTREELAAILRAKADDDTASADNILKLGRPKRPTPALGSEDLKGTAEDSDEDDEDLVGNTPDQKLLTPRTPAAQVDEDDTGPEIDEADTVDTKPTTKPAKKPVRKHESREDRVLARISKALEATPERVAKDLPAAMDDSREARVLSRIAKALGEEA